MDNEMNDIRLIDSITIRYVFSSSSFVSFLSYRWTHRWISFETLKRETMEKDMKRNDDKNIESSVEKIWIRKKMAKTWATEEKKSSITFSL